MALLCPRSFDRIPGDRAEGWELGGKKWPGCVLSIGCLDYVRVQALTKAWRFGQQMRQYFDFGDVRDAIEREAELQRQQVSWTGHPWSRRGP